MYVFQSCQRELFYSFLEKIRVIIRLNSRYCGPYCWLPIEKVPTMVKPWLQVRFMSCRVSDFLELRVRCFTFPREMKIDTTFRIS